MTGQELLDVLRAMTPAEIKQKYAPIRSMTDAEIAQQYAAAAPRGLMPPQPSPSWKPLSGHRIVTSYLTCVLDPLLLEEKLSLARFHLDHLTEGFDSIACRGVSGMMFAPILAHLMHKTVTVVRVDNEGTHSSCLVEGNLTHGLRYVIVDDCISSGKTVETIYRDIKAQVPSATCVAIYLYYSNEICPNYFNDIPGMSRIGNFNYAKPRATP